MKVSGVYKITNKINGKCYIGKSIDIKARFSDHKKPNNLKSHYKIYKAFAKYGIENFSFEILSKCPKEYLGKLEMFFIKHFDSVNNGYNITQGGKGGFGPKHSDGQKEKWRQSRKGVRHSVRTDYSSTEKKIVRISEENIITYFNSISKTGLEITSIVRACNRYKTSKNKGNWSQGYYWMYRSDYELLGAITIKGKITPHNKISIRLISEDGKINSFKSKADACDFLKVKHPTFNKYIGKEYRGYKIEIN